MCIRDRSYLDQPGLIPNVYLFYGGSATGKDGLEGRVKQYDRYDWKCSMELASAADMVGRHMRTVCGLLNPNFHVRGWMFFGQEEYSRPTVKL